jgi:hypothetical protein
MLYKIIHVNASIKTHSHSLARLLAHSLIHSLNHTHSMPFSLRGARSSTHASTDHRDWQNSKNILSQQLCFNTTCRPILYSVKSHKHFIRCSNTKVFCILLLSLYIFAAIQVDIYDVSSLSLKCIIKSN